MKAFVRGAAVLITTAATLIGAAASAQDKTVLTTERDKTSYMVGSDIAQSIAPVAPDIDLAAFERAIKNAFDGGKPLITEDEAQTVGPALMQRIASRAGQAPAGAKVPDVAKDKVAYLVGADVGRSLAPIKDELELPVLMQAIRTAFAKGTPLLSEAEQGAVRQSFQQKVQAKMQAQAAALGDKNKAEGAGSWPRTRPSKGVFTTGSGLQYMVLRQGAGPRPKADRPRPRELPRHAARRHRVRQLLRARPAGRVRAEPGHRRLDRRRGDDAGRQQVPLLDSGRPGLRRRRARRAARSVRTPRWCSTSN